jgi:outer membrane murein-binding lipoprotein Lpp
MRKFQIAALVAGGLLLAGGAAPAFAQDTASAAPRCSAARLQVGVGRVDAGAGQRHATLTFTNRSRSTCSIYGYPGLIMVDKQGDTLRTRVRRASGAKARKTLRPGGRASATLHWTVIESGGEKSCPSAARLLVIPPDEHTYASIAFPAGQVCDDGRLDVTPVK